MRLQSLLDQPSVAYEQVYNLRLSGTSLFICGTIFSIIGFAAFFTSAGRIDELFFFAGIVMMLSGSQAT